MSIEGPGESALKNSRMGHLSFPGDARASCRLWSFRRISPKTTHFFGFSRAFAHFFLFAAVLGQQIRGGLQKLICQREELGGTGMPLGHALESESGLFGFSGGHLVNEG